MSCSGPTPGPERAGADWARAAEGIQLAGIAVFLLLNTTGYLPWSFWLDAIALWPLLIMSAGIRVAFEKTRARWLVMAGPVLILGGLAWVASGARPERPAGPMRPQVAERPAGVDRVEVDAKLLGAHLNVAAAAQMPPGRLVDGASNHERARLETETEGSVVRVRLDGGGHGPVFLPRPRERWDLRLPADLPVRLKVSGAGVGGNLDLTAGTMEGLQTDGVFIGVEARLPAPRENTRIRMNGVFNALTLVVPEGTPVRVQGPGLPFNAVDRGTRGKEGRPGYDVQVQGIFSAVDVRTDGSIPPGPEAPPSPPPGAPAGAREAPPVPPARLPAEAGPVPGR